MLIDRVTERCGDSDEIQVFHVKSSEEQEMTSDTMEFKEKDYTYKESANSASNDLVILYENTEASSKSINESNNLNNMPANQYVETIIYDDDLDSGASDMSEICSNEDLSNVFMINNERIDLLNSIPSFEKRLCHKYGSVGIGPANITAGFDEHFLCGNTYLKHQLNIHAMSQSKYSDSTVIPASLLEYICCKNLEDNYNFYMDNIIIYVQHTIEQLKRISNGDYLTDRAKEKWHEVNNQNTSDYNNTALMSCANIPILIEDKITRQKNTWDDIVHSEMDVRCLTKVLEKKIIVEVPKLLCGTYKLFSRYSNENLIITCKNENLVKECEKKNDAQVNVVLKLKRSNSGKVTSNINSVVVLKTMPCDLLNQESRNDMAVTLMEIKCGNEENVKITEIDDLKEKNELESTSNCSLNKLQCICTDTDQPQKKYITGDISHTKIAGSLLAAPDELGYTMRRLNVHSPVLEENEERSTKNKRSPTRVRIKSPYENRSHIIDERKRRKLLEIREKREKRKIAINEGHKITKSKYGKGAITAQSSNSVTKLSITNKSFYNSIYGQTLNMDDKNIKKNLKRQKTDNISATELDCNEDYKNDVMLTPDKSGQKYINRSYYLDDADTEMMYLEKKIGDAQSESKSCVSPSTTTFSTEFGNLSVLKRLICNTSTTDLSTTDTTSSLHQNIMLEIKQNNKNEFMESKVPDVAVPTNTPKHDEPEIRKYKKNITVQCRKSIDKIYDLMKEKNATETNNKCSELRTKDTFTLDNMVRKRSNITPETEGETTMKYQLITSNSSTFSLNEIKFSTENLEESNRDLAKPTTVTPKVIINSKRKLREIDSKTKKVDRPKIIDNPLKAISQLLHDIDNVQKTRLKNEMKSTKKQEYIKSEIKNNSHLLTNKKQYKSDCETNTLKYNSQKDKKLQQPAYDVLKPSPRVPIEKSINRVNRKKMTDIIDEVKELKGEAVRGPSHRSRLDSLARPRKLYVQAHQEEYRNKHLKQDCTGRQNLASNPLINKEKLPQTVTHGQKGFTDISSTKPTSSSHIEKSTKRRVMFKTEEAYEKKNSISLKKPQNINKINMNPDPLNKKIVAVEKFVNTHFGRILPTAVIGENQKTRAPILPSDIESIISSPPIEESNTLGNKLHSMVNSIIKTNNDVYVMSESKPLATESDKSDSEAEPYQDLVKKHETTASEYSIDVFEDKNIVTAVACIKNNNDSIDVTIDKAQNSEGELKNLRSALQSDISNGIFQKRLRIQKLTLTPKHSMIARNSGDASSLFISSSTSQKLTFSKTDVTELKILPLLSKKSIHKIFPFQVSTVGYAFPKYNKTPNHTSNEEKKFKENVLDNKSLEKKTFKENKGFQCCMYIDKSLKTKECYNPEYSKDKYENNYDCFDCENKPLEVSKNYSDIEDPVKNTEESKKLLKISDNPDTISNSTSLDILVGLLNEIKKITSCQAEVVKYRNEIDLNPIDKEIKVILNNVSENTPDMSIKNSTSLKSLISIKNENYKNYSLIQNNIDNHYCDYDNKRTERVCEFNLQKLFSHKAVTVKMSQKQVVHTFTDAPSCFFSSTINKSTECLNSLKIFAINSSHSMSSFYDRTISRYNTPFQSVKVSCKFEPDLKHDPTNVNKINEIQLFNLTNEMIKYKRTDPSQFDPTMKIKRDILVTLYSVLVLTVFAALTFPDLFLLA